jgi:hypothetical protein
MSQLFGQVRQLGFVVRDLEAAMKHWVETMRVGPFFHFDRGPMLDYRYRGEPHDIWMSAAFAQCGPMQIELIQPRDDTPSMWRDFLRDGHEGLQHIAFWEDASTFDAKLAEAQRAGFTVCMSASTIDATGRIVYFEQQGHPGTAIELSCLTPAKKKVFDGVAEAAVGWDGRDPIRRMDAA